MNDLIAKYRAVLTQGFMPICVADGFRIELLAECVIAAGARAIEITCRRPDARDEIARVKRAHPGLIVLAGSVVDDGPLLTHLQRRQPAMPSLQMLADVGADGFVSALPISLNSIAAWSQTHLLVPGVETPTEACAALEAGAHLAKLFTADLMGGAARAARMTSAPTHGLIPLFITGGITRERISDYLAAGATMLGSGWDVILSSQYQSLQTSPDRTVMVDALRTFLGTFREKRQEISAAWSNGEGQSDQSFLASRTHFVPPAWIQAPKEGE